jgi:membrane associated rhomboid family serine protease
MMNTIFDDFKNAWRKANNGLAQLIIINVVVFVASWIAIAILRIAGMGLGEAKIALFDFIALPAAFESFVLRPWTIITYAFTHTFSLWHIAINMLILYWFGRVFVDFLGSQRLINLYVLGALSGGTVFLFFYNLVPYFNNMMNPDQPTVMVGASGAVFAVIVATATYWPEHRFNLLFIGPVKIIYIAVAAIFLSFISLIQNSNPGGNLAHLAGAMVGFFYARQLAKGNEWGKWVFTTMQFVKSFFVKSPKVKVSHRQRKSSKKSQSRTTTTVGGQERADQEEIDKILDKISERGYDSLTKSEKEKLFNASK